LAKPKLFPIPNPLSRFFHHLPRFFLRGGVLFNHFAELVVPFFLFATSPMRLSAGLFIIAFQLVLILSGNLSWLNWLTIVLCIPCLDDRFLAILLPEFITSKVPSQIALVPPNLWTQNVLLGLFCLVLVLSIRPVLNLFSSRQAMNASYDPFHLVNTYGAFGHVGELRHEVILQGTHDQRLTPDTEWLEYEFKAKPGDVNRRPPIISPYHYRLDWQIWFAAMSPYHHHPWLIHLIYKLLSHDQGLLKLIYQNPFPKKPPKFIRIELYEYRFTPKGNKSGAWWQRQRVESYLPPVELTNEAFKAYLKSYDWIE